MAARRVLPATPNSSEMPYSRIPEEKAPNTKYFAAASSERASNRLKPASTYSERDINSMPR